MNKTVHRIYIGTFVTIVIAAFLSLAIFGMSYYRTPLEERFYHPGHDLWKPSGALGHGLGIIGTLFILIGVFSYMARKRIKRFSRIGVLKYWLEFHIFLCVLGPILVLFHTAFKFGGIVSVSFWSMVVVVASGVIGRFIYIQIPRTIQGRELSLNEIKGMKEDMGKLLEVRYGLSPEITSAIVSSAQKPDEGKEEFGLGKWFGEWVEDRRRIGKIRKQLRATELSRRDSKEILKLAKREITLNNRINRLVLMQRLFRYWHVAHLPFAIVMLIIMIIHVGVTLAFGYRWIF